MENVLFVVLSVCAIILTYFISVAFKELTITLKSVKILVDDFDENLRDINYAKNSMKLGVLGVIGKIFGRGGEKHGR